MNQQQVAEVCAFIRVNWPHAIESREAVTVWSRMLAPLDYDVVQHVLLDGELADADFVRPVKLRAAVQRICAPSVDYNALLTELLAKIAGVGYCWPEPEWSHPAIGEFVARNGGWTEVAQTTPGRSDPHFGTWFAQTREQMKAIIEGVERDATLFALEVSNDLRALDE